MEYSWWPAGALLSGFWIRGAQGGHLCTTTAGFPVSSSDLSFSSCGSHKSLGKVSDSCCPEARLVSSESLGLLGCDLGLGPANSGLFPLSPVDPRTPSILTFNLKACLGSDKTSEETGCSRATVYPQEAPETGLGALQGLNTIRFQKWRPKKKKKVAKYKRESLDNLGLGKDFNVTSKAKSILKIDKLDFIKLKIFWALKITVKRMS